MFNLHFNAFDQLINMNLLLFQFNVQRLHQDAHSLSQPGSSGGAGGVGGLADSHVVSGHTHPLYLQGSAHSSGGSVSSTGGASPTSPLRPGKEEDCSLHGRSSTEGIYVLEVRFSTYWFI